MVTLPTVGDGKQSGSLQGFKIKKKDDFKLPAAFKGGPGVERLAAAGRHSHSLLPGMDDSQSSLRQESLAAVDTEGLRAEFDSASTALKAATDDNKAQSGAKQDVGDLSATGWQMPTQAQVQGRASGPKAQDSAAVNSKQAKEPQPPASTSKK